MSIFENIGGGKVIDSSDLITSLFSKLSSTLNVTLCYVYLVVNHTLLGIFGAVVVLWSSIENLPFLNDGYSNSIYFRFTFKFVRNRHNSYNVRLELYYL
jgi:hypothetical protein